MRYKKVTHFQLATPKIKDVLSPETQEFYNQVQIKPIMLLVAYCYGYLEKFNSDKEQFEKDMELILRSIPHYIDLSIIVAMGLSQMHKQGLSPKQITARTIFNIL